MLRASDFSSATPGSWRIPPIPTWVPMPAHLPKLLPQLTRVTPVTRVTPAAVSHVPTAVPTARYRTPDRTQSTTASNSQIGVRPNLRWRLAGAMRDADRQQLLEALARREDSPVACRRFQNSQHRLETPRYNAALKSLIAAGFVERVKRDRVSCLVLSAEVRHLIGEAQTGVCRAPSARAMRRTKTRTSAGTGQETRTRAAAGTRPYRRRQIPDRRHNPRAWGHSMRARLGGLAVQKLYRKFGVHPTAKATAARWARRAEQERRQSAASASIAYTAPDAPAPATRVPSGEWFSASSAERVAVALHYRQPLGQRERLAADRTRR